MAGDFEEWRAWVYVDTSAGRVKSACIVVGKTPYFYRITCDETVRLAGRLKFLKPGETALVPKHAIARRLDE